MKECYNANMITGILFLKSKNAILAFLMLAALFTAGFTVFCQMPSGNSHSYNLLLGGKDNCRTGQSTQSCGSTQVSQDTLGFKLLNNSLVMKAFSVLALVLLVLVTVFAAIVSDKLKKSLQPLKLYHFKFFQRLPNYLIMAMSRGILNPQVYHA